jgi:hypothetical protein
MRRTSLGDSPSFLWDPAFSVEATTGSHTVPVSTQRPDGSLK